MGGCIREMISGIQCEKTEMHTTFYFFKNQENCIIIFVLCGGTVAVIVHDLCLNASKMQKGKQEHSRKPKAES